MNEATYLPQVFCEIVNDHATSNTVMVGVPDESGNRQLLRVESGAIVRTGNNDYLLVGIVEVDQDHRRALVELPHEADSEASRIWISLDNFRKPEVEEPAPDASSEAARNGLSRKPTTDELLAPFRRQIEESGITDDELDSLFEEVREDVWREKQAKQP